MGEAIPAGQLQYRGLLGKDQPLAHRAQPNKSRMIKIGEAGS